MKLRKSCLLLLSALMLVPAAPYAVQAETPDTGQVTDSPEVQKTENEAAVQNEETQNSEEIQDSEGTPDSGLNVSQAKEAETVQTSQETAPKDQAASESVSWKSTDLFRSGDGTPEHPYTIHSAEDFLKISQFLKENPDAQGYCFSQDWDLDFSGTDLFQPVGSIPAEDGEHGIAFNGTYDGNGFQISGIQASENLKPEQLLVTGDLGYETCYGFGLFLQLGSQSKVCNLKISSDLSIPSYEYTGTSEYSSVKASYGMLAAYAAGTIESVELTGSMQVNSLAPSVFAGSLVGSVTDVKHDSRSMQARILGCESTVNLSVQSSGNTMLVGGLAGNTNEVSMFSEDFSVQNPAHYTSRDNTVFDDCVYDGALKLESPQISTTYTGGIVAFGQNATVQNCVAKVNFVSDFHSTMYPDLARVTGGSRTSETFGAIAGTVRNSTVQNCYTAFKTEVTHQVDDLNGPVNCLSYSSLYGGGIAGQAYGSEIRNCYVDASCEKTTVREEISQGSTAQKESENVFHRIAGLAKSDRSPDGTEYPTVLSGNTASQKCDLLSHPFSEEEIGDSGVQGQNSYESAWAIYQRMFPSKYRRNFFEDAELFELYKPCFTGEGTEELPYLIGNAEDAILFLNCPFDKRGYSFRQTTDIDLSGAEIKAIGFDGFYDGQNHSLNNVQPKPYRDEFGIYLSIFGKGYVGQVKNLTINNPVLDLNVDEHVQDWDPERIPSVHVGTVNANKLIDTDNVHVNNLKMSVYESGDKHQGRVMLYCGGLSPTNNDSGSAKNTSVTGTISVISHNPESVISAGGLLGTQLFYGGVTMDVLDHCTFQGAITAEGYQVSAAGLAATQAEASIQNCAAKGTIDVTLKMTDSSDAIENGANTLRCAGLGATVGNGKIVDSVSDMDISISVENTSEDNGLVPEICTAGLATVGHHFVPRTDLVSNSLNLSDRIVVSCPDAVQPKIVSARIAPSELDESVKEENRVYTLQNNRSVEMLLNDEELNSDVGPDRTDGETVTLFQALNEAHERFPELFEAVVSTAGLEAEVQKALAIRDSLDLYKPEGQERFLAALAAAQEILENPDNVPQESIDAAAEELRQAAMALVLKTPGDVKTLEQIVNAVGTLDLSSYTAQGQQELSEWLEQAQALLQTNAEQDEIDRITTNLHMAYLNLRLKADENLVAQLVGLQTVLSSVEEEAIPAESRALFRTVSQTLQKAQSDPENLSMEEAQEAMAGYEKLQPVIEQALGKPAPAPSEDSLKPTPEPSGSVENKLENNTDQKKAETSQTKPSKTSQKTAKSVRTAAGTGAMQLGSLVVSAGAVLLSSLKTRRKGRS